MSFFREGIREEAGKYMAEKRAMEEQKQKEEEEKALTSLYQEVYDFGMEYNCEEIIQMGKDNVRELMNLEKLDMWGK